MKKIIAAILIIALCTIILAACNKEEYYEYDYPDHWSEDTNAESLTENTTSEGPPTLPVESESRSEASVETTLDLQPAETENYETVTDQITETETRTETNTEHNSEANTETEPNTEPAPQHVDYDENNYCDKCGELIESTESNTEFEETNEHGALFDKFYDKNYDIKATGHSNGSKMTDSCNSYTSGEYELVFQNYSNLYKNARDEKGNSALKVGTTSAVGSFELNIPEDILIVVIRVAKYKDKDSVVLINNVEHVLTKNSNNGEYDMIIIDATKNKTVSVSTTEEYKICMIRSIEFVK